MIDIEAHVFDYVFPYVTALIPETNFRSVYVPSPPSFPFATLMEMDNETDTDHWTTTEDQEFAIVTYEANVYAPDKTDCRAVMDALDTAMTRLGFTRLSMSYVPNLEDVTLFRQTARYRAVADKNNVIYRYH